MCMCHGIPMSISAQLMSIVSFFCVEIEIKLRFSDLASVPSHQPMENFFGIYFTMFKCRLSMFVF